MIHIAFINLCLSVIVFISLIILFKGWRYNFRRDTKLVLIGLLTLIFTHGVINMLEWFRITPSIDPFGDLIETLEPLVWVFFFYVFLKEVEEKKVKESESKYRELFESIKVGIVVHGPEGDIKAANSAAEKALGLKEEELKRQNLEHWEGIFYKENKEIMSIDDFLVSTVLDTKQPVEGTILGISPPQRDEIKWYILSAMPYFNKNGKIKRVITSFEEITEKKKTEERKTFLNTLLRHDLNSKFQNIHGYLQLLEEEELSKEYEKYIKRALKSGKEVNEILELANELKELDEIEWISDKNVAKILEHVISDISDLIDNKDIEIEVRYPEDIGVIGSDYSLEKLFLHLLKTRIQSESCSKLKIEVKDKNDKIIVKIKDDGEKLPPEIKNLFSGKIYIGESSGAGGFRYYMIREIAEHNQANIDVKDSDMGGARFDISLNKTT